MKWLLTTSFILLLSAFLLNNFIIALVGLIILVASFMSSAKKKSTEKQKPVKTKHIVIQSEPPAEEFPEPVMPFHEVIEKASEGKISTDALPLSRAKPHNPIDSLFSVIPFNPFKKIFKK